MRNKYLDRGSRWRASDRSSATVDVHSVTAIRRQTSITRRNLRPSAMIPGSDALCAYNLRAAGDRPARWNGARRGASRTQKPYEGWPTRSFPGVLLVTLQARCGEGVGQGSPVERGAAYGRSSACALRPVAGQHHHAQFPGQRTARRKPRGGISRVALGPHCGMPGPAVGDQ